MTLKSRSFNSARFPKKSGKFDILDFELNYDTYMIHASWSREGADLIERFKNHKGGIIRGNTI
ncbi:MAG: hypothetical protein ACOC35_02350 [Promethearchaeia archaeon]